MNLKLSFNVLCDYKLDHYIGFVQYNYLLILFDVWNERLFVCLFIYVEIY